MMSLLLPKNTDPFKRIGFGALLLFVAALQFSIAVADIFFSLALLMWLLRLITRRTTFDAPAFFIPLAAYGAATLISAAFSSDPAAGFVDSKQLVLFLIVPMVYDFARGASAPLVVQVIISVGAISAAVGVVQYGIFHFDSTEHRVRGSLGHYMTYSGLLMLVICAACGASPVHARPRVAAAGHAGARSRPSPRRSPATPGWARARASPFCSS